MSRLPDRIFNDSLDGDCAATSGLAGITLACLYLLSIVLAVIVLCTLCLRVVYGFPNAALHETMRRFSAAR